MAKLPSPHYARDAGPRWWRWSCHRATTSLVRVQGIRQEASPRWRTEVGGGRQRAFGPSLVSCPWKQQRAQGMEHRAEG